MVASELERQWENALSELRQARDLNQREQQTAEIPKLISQKMKREFENIGKRMPTLWESPLLKRDKKKALLRTLIDKVVVQRKTPDFVHARLVWKGGDSTTAMIPIRVGSFAALSNSSEIEQMIRKLHDDGIKSDKHLASILMEKGFRSPSRNKFLESTVKKIRLRLRLIRKHNETGPKMIPQSLTVEQISKHLGRKRSWVYGRIRRGKINVERDSTTGLYLFPDNPMTRRQFEELLANQRSELIFSQGGHQDE